MSRAVQLDILKIDPDPRLEPAPARTAFDFGFAIAKLSAFALPHTGPAVALIEAIVTPLRGKRFSDWCEELRLMLNDLSLRVEGLTPEKLANDEAFISAFAHATQAALKTHETEKLEALRNALLNVAHGTSISEDQQLMFLALADSFTRIHILVLRAFAPGNAEIETQLRATPELSGIAIRDLLNCGMLRDKRPYASRSRDEHKQLIYETWEVTGVGHEFLDFIKSP
jgi:hypothetical protein